MIKFDKIKKKIRQWIFNQSLLNSKNIRNDLIKKQKLT